jgi:hypothetical protein
MRQDEQAVTKDDKSLVTLADYAAQVGIWLGAQRLGSRAWCHQGKNRWQVPDHACRRRSGWMGGGDDINQRPGRPPDTGAPCAACRFGFRNTFMRVIPKTCLVRPPWSYGSKCAGRGSVGIQLAPFGDLDTAGALWGSGYSWRPLGISCGDPPPESTARGLYTHCACCTLALHPQGAENPELLSSESSSST